VPSPADNGTRLGERGDESKGGVDSPAKALAIDQLQPMLQSRLESKGVAWNAALLRDVSLEMLHSCLQSADVQPILESVLQALDEQDAVGPESNTVDLKTQVDFIKMRVKTDRAALDEALKSSRAQRADFFRPRQQMRTGRAPLEPRIARSMTSFTPPGAGTTFRMNGDKRMQMIPSNLRQTGAAMQEVGKEGERAEKRAVTGKVRRNALEKGGEEGPGCRLQA